MSVSSIAIKPKVAEWVRARLATQWSTDTFNIEYGGFLSNHLSHGVIALDLLGASDTRINEFVEEYKTKLQPPSDDDTYQHSPLARVDRFDEQLLGERTNWRVPGCRYGLLEFYKEQARELGWREAVARFFPRLAGGLSGAAFHGVIHVGYGVRSECEQLVCEGLAYLHHSYLPLPFKAGAVTAHGEWDMSELLQAVRTEGVLADIIRTHQEEGREHYKGKTSKFQIKMAALSLFGQPAINALTQKLCIPQDTDLGTWMVEQAIEVYGGSSRTNDFFLLHGVSSAWALKHVLPLLGEGDRAPAARDYVNALVATYAAQEQPLALEAPWGQTPEVGDWEQLVQTTLAFDGDEHVYKLVLACVDMAAADPQRTKWAMLYYAAETALTHQFTF